jgi:hypothetical protein
MGNSFINRGKKYTMQNISKSAFIFCKRKERKNKGTEICGVKEDKKKKHREE